MTTPRLIAQSLRHSWRTHLGTTLAAALTTAVLVGALLVGDSVRHTLRRAALDRLGDTHLAMSTGDRFFSGGLAASVADATEAPLAPALSLKGVATVPGSDRKVMGVNIYGVDASFWSMMPAQGGDDDAAVGRPENSVLLNGALAQHLGIKAGDDLVLRIAKPSSLSRDIPLGSETRDAVALRVVVGDPTPAGFGRDFGLKSEQLPPFNAFVSLPFLRKELALEERANLMLVGPGQRASPAALHEIVRRSWRLSDAQATLRSLENSLELRSDRVFLDPPLVAAAMDSVPGGSPSLTYFVNKLEAGGRATPYSMVTASVPETSDLLPDDMAEDEIVITDWLAEDLGIGPGEGVTLTYDTAGDGRKLIAHSATFKVKAVVPTEAPGGDRHLMPEFPGLTNADSPLDWDPPADLNIDLSRIRKKDEKYWEEHRGAPKAFVSLAWAEKHWGTRFGTYTSVRWPAGSVKPEEIEARIRKDLDPATLGLFFRDVRTPALQAAEQGYDFGQLFIGFSFFLIVAALVLTGLMFAFGVEQRTPQIGALLAMGFRPGHVQRLLLSEGFILALAGAFIGAPLGLAYTRAVLWGLANRWNEVIGMTELQFHAEPASMVVGVVAGLAMAVIAMAWVLRRQMRRPVRTLLAARYGTESPQTRGRRGFSFAWVGLAVVTALALTTTTDPDHAAGAFFGAGAMLLLGGLAFASVLLRSQPRESSGHLTLWGVGWRNSGRRRGRSLATIAMLSAGTFLLVAINAFRHDAGHAPESATLGFDLFAQSTIPISHDMNTPRGREAVGLGDGLEGLRVVQMRLLEGDDASCLNLNRPQAPPLLAVDPSMMTGDVWKPLAQEGEGFMPALVDGSVAQWVLHKKVGDVIEYLDERGRTLPVKIVGTLPKSILQGYLVVPESGFKKHFPSVSGYRVFLMQAPDGAAHAVRESAERALSDYGFLAMTTAQRLALYNAVENTYLTIFSVLGGLGVLLGSLGLALVVLRNVLERRGELALLQAVGFRHGAIRGLLLAEHWGLVAMGLLCGVVAALVAVTPALRTRESGLPYDTLLVITAAIAIGSLLWTCVASLLAIRGKLTNALRND